VVPVMMMLFTILAVGKSWNGEAIETVAGGSDRDAGLPMILSGCHLDGLIYLALHHQMLQNSYSTSDYLEAILGCLCRLACAFPDAVELPPFAHIVISRSPMKSGTVKYV
jgi:hypothetical protein